MQRVAVTPDTVVVATTVAIFTAIICLEDAAAFSGKVAIVDVAADLAPAVRVAEVAVSGLAALLLGEFAANQFLIFIVVMSPHGTSNPLVISECLSYAEFPPTTVDDTVLLVLVLACFAHVLEKSPVALALGFAARSPARVVLDARLQKDLAVRTGHVGIENLRTPAVALPGRTLEMGQVGLIVSTPGQTWSRPEVEESDGRHHDHG